MTMYVHKQLQTECRRFAGRLTVTEAWRQSEGEIVDPAQF
jgi:hypothetical protein